MGERFEPRVRARRGGPLRGVWWAVSRGDGEIGRGPEGRLERGGALAAADGRLVRQIAPDGGSEARQAPFSVVQDKSDIRVDAIGVERACAKRPPS
mgnify:CR=1 FL=1